VNFRGPGVERRREDLRVEITPLIDVVFLLLIFFTITTTFVTTPGIRVRLPKASAAETQPDDHDATVVLTTEGEIIFAHRKVDIAELEQGLAELAASNADTMLIVQADEKVPHGRVVQVMDLAKGKGLQRLAIATRSE